MLDIERGLVLGREHEDGEDVAVAGVAGVPVLPGEGTVSAVWADTNSSYNCKTFLLEKGFEYSDFF